MVKGPFIAFGADTVNKGAIHFSQHNQPLMVVKQLYAGGDQSFVYATAARCKERPLDSRLNPLVQHLLHISEEVVQNLSKVPAVSKPCYDVIQ
jgi:hypothetical protein